MNNLWEGNYLWVFTAYKYAGGIEKAVNDAVRFGYDGIWVKSHDGNRSDDDKFGFWEDSKKAVDLCRQAGLKVGLWGYHYGPRYGVDQAKVEAEATIDSLGLEPDLYIIDAEREYETLNSRQVAKEMLQRVRAGYPHAVLGYSPIWNVRYHKRYPHQVFSEYCDFVAPQFYWVLAQRRKESEIREMWNIIKEDFEPLGLPIAPAGQLNNSTKDEIELFYELIGDRGSNWWLWDGANESSMQWASVEEDFQAKYEQERATNEKLRGKLQSYEGRLRQVHTISDI